VGSGIVIAVQFIPVRLSRPPHIHCSICGRKFCHTTIGKGESMCRAWICGGRDKRTGINCTAMTIPEPTLMAVTADVFGLDEFDGDVFNENADYIIANQNRLLTFVMKNGTHINMPWQRRKTVPYSKIGIEKRQGHNICYSIIGKGNGKIGERRRREAEHNAQCTGNTCEET
jgi:hypothetical protein